MHEIIGSSKIGACRLAMLAAAAALARSMREARAQAFTHAGPDLPGIRQIAGDAAGIMEGDPPLSVWGRERFELSKPIAGPRAVSATQAGAAELTYARPWASVLMYERSP